MLRISSLLLFFFCWSLAITQSPIETAVNLKNERKYDEATDLLLNSIKDLDTIEKYIYLDEVAKIYGLQGKYEEGFKLQETSLAKFKEFGIDSLIFKALEGISNFFNYKGDYDSADKYHRQALPYASNKRDSSFILANLGINFKHQEQFDSASYYYLKGLSLNQTDTSFLIRSYNNLALLEKRKGDKLAALNYYEKAIIIAKKAEMNARATALQVNITYVLYDLGEFQKAEEILNNTQEVTMSKGTVQEKLNFTLIRFNIAEKLGKATETLTFYKNYQYLLDSLDNLKLNTQIAEFETKYETAEKEKLIAIQDQKLEQNKFQRKLLLGLLAGALWFGLFGVLYYWSRNKFNQKLATEKLKTISMSGMLQGQENERMRIAQDLHDSLGGLLTTIKLQFNAMQGQIKDIMVNGENLKVESLIDKASVEVRRISHNMAPRVLNLAGLKAAIGDMATEINAAGSLKVEYEWIGGELPENDDIMIYRMVQELTNNAMKHSKAKNLLIQVNVRADQYTILVEDDGCGFDSTRKDGMGLLNCESRANIINAEILCDSVLGKGTSVSIVKEL